MEKLKSDLLLFVVSTCFVACSDGQIDSDGPIGLLDPVIPGDVGRPYNEVDLGFPTSEMDSGTTPPRDSGMFVPSADGGAQPQPDGAPPGNPDPLPEDPGHNAGWIGGPCDADTDCTYEEAFCLTDAEGYPRGLCSLDCDRFCPDRDGMPVTFCIDEIVSGNGGCVQRCDYNVFPNGCRPGYRCETRPRYGDPEVGRGVCLPGTEEFEPGQGGCLDELDQRGLNYNQIAPISDVPEDAPHLRCVIDTPIRLQSPVAGITWQYLDNDPSSMPMACELAISIHRLSQLLAEYDVVAVGHIGTYNCRTIRGNDGAANRISQHGLGRAIDLRWFRQSNGTVYDVYDHWEHGAVDDFSTPEAAFLYAIAQEMHLRRIFNIVLTPEYNDAHDNHFHVDITEGSHFIGTLNDLGHTHACQHGAP